MSLTAMREYDIISLDVWNIRAKLLRFGKLGPFFVFGTLTSE
jgi:hypothetical protein